MGKSNIIFPALRVQMAKADMTVMELADKSGIPRTTMADKMHGKTKITLDMAVKIRDTLGAEMPVEKLFSTEVMS